MASNWLRGLGSGVAATGEMVGRGMMADAQAKREQEAEARREASMERRWNKEAAMRKTERAEDKATREAERKAEFIQRDKEQTANLGQQKYAVDASNARTDKQLALMEKRSLVDDVNAVEQAGMTAIGNIQKQFLEKSQELIELYPDPAQRAAEVKKLDAQLQQAVGQVNAQVSTRRQQVAGAYGALGKEYLQNIEYAAPETGLFDVRLPGAEGTDVQADKGVESPGAAKVPTVTQPDNFSFGPVFDIARQTATGRVPLAKSLEQAKGLYERPKSIVDMATVPAGALGGMVVGGLENVGGGLWDLATTRR